MSKNIKRMSVKEFRKLGGLQEINRCFLHPRGLALEVIIGDDGNEKFGEVWDYRDDPEGLFFSENTVKHDGVVEMQKLYDDKKDVRKKVCGTIIQKLKGE